ncbi:integral membrane protein TIGR01906 [Dehalogenimonas lykanthroporepellens BL-DC-9]|jgi:integral membrane protein (TIGR01906 family)|nr:integral membrane protein TIGR01906 [Dehalogenimonas lykanthroporepellens BL-DC-9]
MKLAPPSAYRVAAWGLAVAVPLFIVAVVIAAAVNLSPLYHYGFDRYNVAAVTGLEQAELEKAADGLIDYFNSSEEYIELTVLKDGEPFVLFNEREVIHLYDVKGLIRLDYRILAGTAGYILLAGAFLLYRSMPRLASAPLFWGGAVTLAGLGAATLAAVVDFDALFTQFHLISFANDLWLLNPATDYLIMLFPGPFWQDAAIVVGAGIGLLAAVVLVIGWRGMGAPKERQENQE